MAFMFLFDEYTDKLDCDGTRVFANMVMDALRNPHVERPKDEPNLGEIARQCAPIQKYFIPMPHGGDLNRFSLHAIQVASVSSLRRFITAFEEYVHAVIDETVDRAQGRIRDIADYLKLRRLTIGGYPSFLCLELGLDIPDEVMEHAAIKSLFSLTAETILLTNVSHFHADASKYLKKASRICTHTTWSKQGAIFTTLLLL
jgi:Delta6-protoilludene synthase